jgi:hypothetical protein
MDALRKGFLEFDKCVHIEDQTDGSVTKYSGSCQKILILECFAQAFDDNLLFSNEFIDKNAAHGVTGFDDNDDALFISSRFNAGCA